GGPQVEYAGPDARVPKELIVQIKTGVSLDRIDALFAQVKGTSSNLVLSTYRLTFDHQPTGADIATLKKNSIVENVSFNYYLAKCGESTPAQQANVPAQQANIQAKLAEDPYFASEWHIPAVHAAQHQPKSNFGVLYLIDTGTPYPQQGQDLDC